MKKYLVWLRTFTTKRNPETGVDVKSEGWGIRRREVTARTKEEALEVYRRDFENSKKNGHPEPIACLENAFSKMDMNEFHIEEIGD